MIAAIQRAAANGEEAAQRGLSHSEIGTPTQASKS